MMELGWIFFDRAFEARPKLILRQQSGEPPPVDLCGHIHQTYSSPAAADLEGEIERAIRAQPDLKALREGRPARFLSTGLLDGLPLEVEARKAIARAFDTVDQVLGLDERAFGERLRAIGQSNLTDFGAVVRAHLERL